MNRLLRSFVHAFRGIRDTIRTEPNARIHAIIAPLVIGCGFWLDIAPLEWIAIVGCIGAVLGGECLNTGIEKLADATQPDPHPLVGKAKDAAAAGVLLLGIASIIIGAIIFLPKLVERFHTL